jgi:putative transposase
VIDVAACTTGIRVVRIPPCCPRANCVAERFVCTLRAELIDRMLIFSQRHLRVVLSEYVRHCNGRRPYRARALRDRPTLSWTSAVDASSVDRLWVA